MIVSSPFDGALRQVNEMVKNDNIRYNPDTPVPSDDEAGTLYSRGRYRFQAVAVAKEVKSL